MSLPHPHVPESEVAAPISGADEKVRRRNVRAWALWDWGSAAFNAVVTTFVFSRYLASSFFVDPNIVASSGGGEPSKALTDALAGTATVVSLALFFAGLAVGFVAPVIGQRSDGSGKRKLWLGVNSALVVICMASMFFVLPSPDYLILGALLLALGNIFFEFASVNYNAMLVQVSTKQNMGRVSAFGWGMGYIGGIALLLLLLLALIGDALGVPEGGQIGLPFGLVGEALNIRIAIVVSAIWFAVFAIPLLIRVPESPARESGQRVGFLRSYALLWNTLTNLWRSNRQVLQFLLASAVFRDGLAGVFTLGAIIASQSFGFSAGDVLVFAVAANLVAGAGTFASGWLEDRLGPKRIIMGSLIGLVASGTVVLFVPTTQIGFWMPALFLCLFVGPVQSASRSFLARIIPEGREGEIFGLYATTGRAVSFLAPGLFALIVWLSGDTRLGILGIVLVLLAGLLLMIPVKAKQAVID